MKWAPPAGHCRTMRFRGLGSEASRDLGCGHQDGRKRAQGGHDTGGSCLDPLPQLRGAGSDALKALDAPRSLVSILDVLDEHVNAHTARHGVFTFGLRSFTPREC